MLLMDCALQAFAAEHLSISALTNMYVIEGHRSSYPGMARLACKHGLKRHCKGCAGGVWRAEGGGAPQHLLHPVLEPPRRALAGAALPVTHECACRALQTNDVARNEKAQVLTPGHLICINTLKTGTMLLLQNHA